MSLVVSYPTEQGSTRAMAEWRVDNATAFATRHGQNIVGLVRDSGPCGMSMSVFRETVSRERWALGFEGVVHAPTLLSVMEPWGLYRGGPYNFVCLRSDGPPDGTPAEPSASDSASDGTVCHTHTGATTDARSHSVPHTAEQDTPDECETPGDTPEAPEDDPTPTVSTRLSPSVTVPSARDFMQSHPAPSLCQRSVSAVLGEKEDAPGRGLFGEMRTEDDTRGDLLNLNIRDPFAAVVCGIQNSGKSHTLNTIIESCTLSCPDITRGGDMATLVCSYDTDPNNVCESLGLALPLTTGPVTGLAIPTVVLTSPSNYIVRRRFLESKFPGVQVLPLVIPFGALTGTMLEQLMGLADVTHPPLYADVAKALPRKVQSRGDPITWTGFQSLLMDADFDPKQRQHLTQRLALLESLVAESSTNKRLGLTGAHEVIASDISDRLVVCDLTDPHLTSAEANSLFSVVTHLFLSGPRMDRLVVLDEAHKYLAAGVLCDAMVKLVRQIRHLGARVVFSTQSPTDIPETLLELCSLAVIHQLISPMQAKHLCHTLNLGMDSDTLLLTLSECPTGVCLVYDPHASHTLGTEAGCAIGNCIKVSVRPRLTTDLGGSERHGAH
ncbi:hypothetical protein KIPB_000085 [Kipferlia bialata]|uniref:Helicase HerA-like C-terminal domain-containing protein n=1 Tax=Kipferlia bialata TaxID=797122 RepID=A0A9K3GEG6_9EUKA|nr:hypothetical protein KIPB_000085 [Kipferlia bialata]|eukprot:g85.t1